MIKQQRLFVYLAAIMFFVFSGCDMTAKESFRNGEIAKIPQMTVEIGDRSYTVDHGGYTLEKRSGGAMTVETTDAASPNQIAADFTPFDATIADEIEIIIADTQDIMVFEWDEHEQIGEINVEEQSFTLPDEPTTMIIEVVATWKNAEASYTFVVDVAADP